MKAIRNKLKHPHSIKVDSIDFPIIDENNAIFYEMKNEDYQKSFPVPNISRGIMMHQLHSIYGNYIKYYFFDHNILTTPRHNRRDSPIGSIASYNIYQITPNKFKEINESGGFYSYWDLHFNCWINYGENLNYVRIGDHVTIKKTIVPIIDGKLEIPDGISPSDLKDDDDIQTYISNHTTQYKLAKLNKKVSVHREIMLQSLFG